LPRAAGRRGGQRPGAATLTHWRADSDLTELREPSALDKLSVDELRDHGALFTLSRSFELSVHDA
jgi:hypothetical protein